MTDIVMLGAGGHARVLVAALALQGIVPIGCLSPVPPGPGWPSDIPHLGNDEHLATLDPSCTQFVNGIGSTGSTTARRQLYEAIVARGFEFATVIHPSAVIADNVELGDGAQIMAGAIIQTGAVIGPNTIVNTGAIVDHDCRIDAHCHIAPGASLSGSVELGAGVHVGTGATIIQSIRIGAVTLIGAGAVVVRDVGPGLTVVGNPARPLPQRTVTV
jgi:UDP-perosamine 4-acetyltransferase